MFFSEIYKIAKVKITHGKKILKDYRFNSSKALNRKQEQKTMCVNLKNVFKKN